MNWISVKNRLPDKEEVIVYGRVHKQWFVSTGYWEKDYLENHWNNPDIIRDRWVWTYDGEREDCEWDEVTHWMNLPEAPL